jgi:hypothetical protein
MSLPQRDPNFTVAELELIGQKLLDAAFEYWIAAHKAGIHGAVIWLKSRDRFVIFTRGEYAEQLMRNIEDISPTIQFGHTAETTHEN